MSSSSTFPEGRPAWLARVDHVRHVVRQEVVSRHLSRHLPASPGTVLDIGTGQGVQALRLARAGHRVVAVEPDPEMRTVFASALAEETDDVRARVELVAGDLEHLSRVVRDPAGFDVVLLLGVLMYLPSTAAVLARMAEQVRPGGIAVLAVRTTTSALWRPAARQDWAAALAAFEEHEQARFEHRDVRYVNELGTPARAVDLDRLVDDATAYGLELEEWYGVRIAVDAAELDPLPPADPRMLAALIEVEERLGATEPFRQLGQLALVVLRAAGDRGTGGSVY